MSDNTKYILKYQWRHSQEGSGHDDGAMLVAHGPAGLSMFNYLYEVLAVAAKAHGFSAPELLFDGLKRIDTLGGEYHEIQT